MIFSYEVDGQIISLQLTRLPDGRYEARIGQQTWRLSAVPLPDGGYALALEDGQRLRGYVARRGEERFVHLAGHSYSFSSSTGRPRRGKRQGHAGDLTAQMPGQVREVRVRPGERVQAGQVLLVMEAMKMELRVSANADGVVRRLLVEAGQVVERGQLLIEIGDEVT